MLLHRLAHGGRVVAAPFGIPNRMLDGILFGMLKCEVDAPTHASVARMWCGVG
jgi:hypothetical protein